MLEFHAKAQQATASEGLAQGPYVATREVEFAVVLDEEDEKPVA